jgi:uncharacterized protein YybS (DUF2232 family)
MKTINARAMMEGAILAALTAILGMFYNVPVVGAITMFWPVPIIIVGYRNGFKVSLIAAFIAAVLASFVATPIVGIILFVTYGIPGAVMGYMMKKKYNPGMILAVCAVILAIAAALEFVLSMELLLGIDVINIIRNPQGAVSSYFNEIYRQAGSTAEIYTQYGIDEAGIKQAMESVNVLLQQARLLLPGGFVFAGIVSSFINFKAVKLILGRIGYKIEDINKFSEWRLNKAGMFALMGITLVLLLLKTLKIQFLSDLSTNAWILLMMIYAVLGLSVVVYFKERLGERYKISKPIENLVFVIYVSFIVGILPYIGLFDAAIDIRKFYRNIPGGAR